MPSSPPFVEACDFPVQSVLYPDPVRSSYFHDSYCAPLTHPRESVVKIFVAIFSHRPLWMKAVMVLRNWVAELFGIEVPTTAEMMNPQFKDSYAVGEKIGAWPVFAMSETELVAGRDNRHLDFRLSILRLNDGNTASTVVSTVCLVHNSFGKAYLLFIIPFHKWGVRWLIRTAVRAGRL